MSEPWREDFDLPPNYLVWFDWFSFLLHSVSYSSPFKKVPFQLEPVFATWIPKKLSYWAERDPIILSAFWQCTVAKWSKYWSNPPNFWRKILGL